MWAFPMVLEETYEACVESLLAFWREYMTKTVSWLKPDLEDFGIEVSYDEVQDGKFWRPCTSRCHRYRVSDGKRS
jgi:hypothetical protein